MYCRKDRIFHRPGYALQNGSKQKQERKISCSPQWPSSKLAECPTLSVSLDRLSSRSSWNNLCLHLRFTAENWFRSFLPDHTGLSVLEIAAAQGDGVLLQQNFLCRPHRLQHCLYTTVRQNWISGRAHVYPYKFQPGLVLSVSLQ